MAGNVAVLAMVGALGVGAGLVASAHAQALALPLVTYPGVSVGPANPVIERAVDGYVNRRDVIKRGKGFAVPAGQVVQVEVHAPASRVAAALRPTGRVPTIVRDTGENPPPIVWRVGEVETRGAEDRGGTSVFTENVREGLETDSSVGVRNGYMIGRAQDVDANGIRWQSPI